MVDGNELYRIPTLILLVALAAVFGALWLESGRHPERGATSREVPSGRGRQLLWLVGWMFAAIQMEMEILGGSGSGVWLAVAHGAMQMAPLMFLGSLAPQYFSRRPRIPYVVAFGAPLIVFAALVSIDPNPSRLAQGGLLACAFWAAFVAVRWSLHRNLIPEWLSLTVVAAGGSACLWLTWNRQYDAVLALVHSGVLLMTAFLFASAFRRLTAGVVFTAGGLALWSLPVLLAPLAPGAEATILLVRVINLTKVITAVGMIVLVLEDEIASNRAAQERDRRAREEMEKYTEVYLEDIPFEEESGQYDALCATIASVSRFRQAVVFVRTPDGRFRLAGRAGINGALEGALDALARRTTEEKVQEVAAGQQHFSERIGHLLLMNLRPLMEPGDELLQMNFRQGYVMGIRTREGRLLGALLLAGLSNPEEPLLTEDVLPLELLVARIGAAREHQALLRQLLQAERLAGLGQLAGGVAHELNNPLTVVTGYAELMAEDENTMGREQALVILNEARRMKQIIESLMRFRKASATGNAPLAVELLLRDIEKLARHELESARVELELRIPREVPRVKADGEQLRQVFLQITQNAIASLLEVAKDARRLRVEVVPIGNRVQITFADNGPGFVEPARVFDPFFTTRQPGEGVGLGLSVCYSIVREHGGTITAENLRPHGAAVVIDLPADSSGLPAETIPGAARAV
ncbi:MAG: ATP-binding protein [Acidobacteriaceae bacterium]